MITKHKIKPGYTGIYIPENKLEKARVINSGIFWETPFISGSFCRLASIEQQLRIDDQEILTKDNISLRISALVRFQIVDPISYLKAYGIKDEQYDKFKQEGLLR
jgi:regulator of protease activity HflC (stomatin/prohibitin superfamily)